MATVVHKYGGTSVGSTDRIKAVADRIRMSVADCSRLEIGQIVDYDAFKDLGHKSKVRPPKDHKLICVHLL